MGAYLLKRLLLIIPTLFGIMLVSFVIIQFAPGGPIERIIAQVSGTDVSMTQRIGGGGGDGITSGGQVPGAADASTSKDSALLPWSIRYASSRKSRKLQANPVLGSASK